jgi:hypothetical protein
VRYTKVVSTHDGGSRFEDVDVEMKTALAAKGVLTSDGARREFGPGDVVLVVRRPIPHWSTWDRAVRFVASPHGPGV